MIALSMILFGAIVALWPHGNDELAEVGAYIFWAGIVCLAIGTAMAWASSRVSSVR